MKKFEHAYTIKQIEKRVKENGTLKVFTDIWYLTLEEVDYLSSKGISSTIDNDCSIFTLE